MSAPRRVRTIYSVIASPNRLDILRILNTKGPLSYSELKTLAGFKSKKESGKFAYHLRKLVKQTLISLNRGERKYAVTSLGRLVLNLTRQIEEQSLLESGRLYVRSSRQAMEEFNSDKILQSLVKEAEMPVELANKIASETEARVYKFQAAYLTAPLIREVVNSILVEHGFEEYRHKLTRLGLPVHDVASLIWKTADSYTSAPEIFAETSNKVLSEYALLTKIPRDVADAHLSGDINLSRLGTWTLMPDTLYFDLNTIYSNKTDLGSKIAYLPRFLDARDLDSAVESLLILSRALVSEVSNEICFDNFLPFMSRFMSTMSQSQRGSTFSTLLCSLFAFAGIGPARRITLRLGKTDDIELRNSLLQTYSRLVFATPVAPVSLIVNPADYMDAGLAPLLSEIVNRGGELALESEGRFAFAGLRIDSIMPKGNNGVMDGCAFLQNLTLNLPRLAYESNMDETYFRAKLALLLQTALSALSTRREYVRDVMKRGLLPALSKLPIFSSIEDMPLVVNMVGLNEAISSLISERESLSRREIALKVLDTAGKIASEKAAKQGQRAFVSLVASEGISRFADLDADKYGRGQELRERGYQVGLSILADHIDNQEILSNVVSLAKSASGGARVRIELPKVEETEMNFAKLIESSSGKIPFVRLCRNSHVCKKCGLKSFTSSRCKQCGSTSLFPQPSLED